MGDIEADHGERHACLEHHMRRMGIGVNVELGRRRNVAEPDRAPHGHDLAHVGEDRRVLDDGQRDIGEGPKGRQRDGFRRGRERVHQEIHRMGRFRRSARLGQVGAVDPRRPVDIFGGLRLAHHRSRAAGIDRHLGPACQILIRRALFSVRASGTLPATAVMPSRSNSSAEANASRRATASSWPGSQSMISGRALMAILNHT